MPSGSAVVQRHADVEAIDIELVAPADSAPATRFAHTELTALATHYVSVAVDLKWSPQVSAKFLRDRDRFAFQNEYDLATCKMMPAPELTLRFSGVKKSVESAKHALEELTRGARPQQLKIACPEWLWQAVRSRHYYPEIDALRDRLNQQCRVCARYESLVPKRQPGVFASLSGQRDAVAAAEIEVHAFLRDIRGRLVAQPLSGPLASPATIDFLAKDGQRVLHEVITGSGCGFELIAGGAAGSSTNTTSTTTGAVRA